MADARQIFVGNASSNSNNFDERMRTWADGSISRTQSTADAARWSNWPGRYSTAMYFRPARSHESVTLSVTTSPKTL